MASVVLRSVAGHEAQNNSGAGCSATTDFTPRRHAAAPILEDGVEVEARTPCALVEAFLKLPVHLLLHKIHHIQ